MPVKDSGIRHEGSGVTYGKPRPPCGLAGIAKKLAPVVFEVWVFVIPMAWWLLPAELPGFFWECFCPCWLVGVVGGDEFDILLQFFLLEKILESVHSSWGEVYGSTLRKPEEDGFGTCRERIPICERQMFAKLGKKCADDDFTLEVWVLGRKGSWGCPVRCFQWCIASKRRWILIWWGVNKKSSSCDKGIFKNFARQK